MSPQRRYVTIAVSVLAWSGVLLVVTYWSHTLKVFGQYSWSQVTLLVFLAYTAVMAEHMANDIVSYWTTKSSRTPVASQREESMSRAGSRVTDVKVLAMGLAQTLSEAKSGFVCIFTSCKKVTRGLMSSESRL